MKLSKKIKELKEKIMLDIHNKPIPISLNKLKQYNTNIEEAIKQIEKGEGHIKIIHNPKYYVCLACNHTTNYAPNNYRCVVCGERCKRK